MTTLKATTSEMIIHLGWSEINYLPSSSSHAQSNISQSKSWIIIKILLLIFETMFYSPDWSRTHDPPAESSQVLGVIPNITSIVIFPVIWLCSGSKQYQISRDNNIYSCHYNSCIYFVSIIIFPSIFKSGTSNSHEFLIFCGTYAYICINNSWFSDCLTTHILLPLFISKCSINLETAPSGRRVKASHRRCVIISVIISCCCWACCCKLKTISKHSL